MSDLERQHKSLPQEPGIYKFKKEDGTIIYIGKAKNLKARVSSYFGAKSFNDPYYEDKINRLVKRIDSIEYIVTDNEKEAFILENMLIKKHHPRFNVFMRDSKSYPWVMITYSEKYPRIRIMRNPRHYDADNVFLGPYTDKKEIQRILRDLRKVFPYCSCSSPIKKRERPCLYYQLNLCTGPCIEAISPEEYIENIKQIEMFLRGDTAELTTEIKEKMQNAAEKKNYEVAAYWRDKLKAIIHTTTEQHVILKDQVNKDIIGFYNEDDFASMVIIHIREGRISNKSSYTLNLKEKVIQQKDILTSLLEQYYQNTHHSVPEDIIIPEDLSKISLLANYLREDCPDAQIRMPSDSNERALRRIARKNAKVMVNQKRQMQRLEQEEKENLKEILKGVKELLNLPRIPNIIEGFDISNIEGQDATGSMVYFLEGKPYKKNYRHYKIRSKATPDDVGMMKEVIERRYSRLLEHDRTLPDLILIDGGRGQLNGAISVLNGLGLDIPAIGLAKRLEEIVLPDQKDSILLPMDSPILRLFQQIRDEAHRFAVRLHKKRRKKRYFGSKLEDIKGIGPATRNKLLRHFGSLKGVRNASEQELVELVGETLGKKIKNYFRKN